MIACYVIGVEGHNGWILLVDNSVNRPLITGFHSGDADAKASLLAVVQATSNVSVAIIECTRATVLDFSV